MGPARHLFIWISTDSKPVNDRHGHATGDAVLTAIAAALLRHVRASDVVAGVGKVTSRNDVRRELVFDEGYAVAQLQLALLQALHLDDVGAR